MKKVYFALVSFQLLFSSLVVSSAHAQVDEELIKNTQTDMIIVASAGAAGAVLGLSTLSFVDRPSKHVSNIWTGGALGIIAGVLYVAYNSAQKGSEDLQSDSAALDFSTSERFAWHMQNNHQATFENAQFGSQFFHFRFQ